MKHLVEKECPFPLHASGCFQILSDSIDTFLPALSCVPEHSVKIFVVAERFVLATLSNRVFSPFFKPDMIEIVPFVGKCPTLDSLLKDIWRPFAACVWMRKL